MSEPSSCSVGLVRDAVRHLKRVVGYGAGMRDHGIRMEREKFNPNVFNLARYPDSDWAGSADRQ